MTTVQRKTLGWYGHVAWMSDERKARLVMEARTEGKRGRGRRRLEWNQYVESIASGRGKTMNEVKRMAQDRIKFREWLKEPDA